MADCFETGDLLGSEGALRAAAELIEEIDHPSVAWRLPVMEAMRALWNGSLGLAPDKCDQAAALGARSGDPNARSTTLFQRQRILRLLGRVEELKADMVEMERLFQGTPIMERYMRVFNAGHLFEVGEGDAALR